MVEQDLSLVLSQYAERLRRKKKSRGTIQGFASAATRYDRWLRAHGKTAEEATFADVEDYIDQLELSPLSKGTHLRWIKAAYNYGMLRGTIRSNPALDVDVEEAPFKEPRIIPIPALREIRAGIQDQRDWLFFHVLT